MKFPVLSAALFVVLTTLAPAAVINIDFTAGALPITQSGLAAAADPAGSAAYWNAVARDGSKDKVVVMPLLDSAGQSTSASLLMAVSGSFSSIPGGDQERGGAGLEYQGLMSDYMFIDAGGPGLVTTLYGSMSGLQPFGTYELYFYGQGDKFTGNVYRGQNTLFTLDGMSKQTAWDGFQGGNGLLAEGVEYVKFDAKADATGTIHFAWSNVVAGVNVAADADGSNSRFAAFNGMQIVSTRSAVPEPSAIVLGALGMLVLLWRRSPRYAASPTPHAFLSNRRNSRVARPGGCSLRQRTPMVRIGLGSARER